MSDEDDAEVPDTDTPGRLQMPQREFEAGAQAWMRRAIDAISRELHPLLKEVRRETVSDLPAPISDGEAPPPHSSPNYRSLQMSFEWLVDINEPIEFDVDALLSRLFEAAESIGGDLTGGILGHISDICEEAGQVVNGAGRDLYESMIEAAHNVEFSFDEDGTPNHVVVMHPDLKAELEANPPTPDQEARMVAVIDRKRKEWNASRRRSDLP